MTEHLKNVKTNFDSIELRRVEVVLDGKEYSAKNDSKQVTHGTRRNRGIYSYFIFPISFKFYVYNIFRIQPAIRVFTELK